jgi:hypothetical protein
LEQETIAKWETKELENTLQYHDDANMKFRNRERGERTMKEQWGS